MALFTKSKDRLYVEVASLTLKVEKKIEVVFKGELGFSPMFTYGLLL